MLSTRIVFAMLCFKESGKVWVMIHRARHDCHGISLQRLTPCAAKALKFLEFLQALTGCQTSRMVFIDELSGGPKVCTLGLSGQGGSDFQAAQLRLEAHLPFRMVEVGVFKGNFTQHVWHRAARRPGAFELHLVDHWGAADRPMGVASQALGTGSDMGGQSNASLMRSVWRSFGRAGARRACAALNEAKARFRADVLFHRSTSVGPSRCFKEDSLDLVYIDADHKMGHDFHFNTLMEREELAGGSINDVPIAVALQRQELCDLLRRRFATTVTAVHAPSSAVLNSESDGAHPILRALERLHVG
ncbi:hypothetical protein AK812_SmicGene21230 [Symbiodinium microadriaticum]|uniref:Uncharacterized protein n=1 Tax=Symbiodinium microadriaticum TaxID=2951 RepID=A0A1Q9DMW5_SYMMI|nr:hypothetical protein AK812_SmicGene21230 [Symbiodinium microadriaticum]